MMHVYLTYISTESYDISTEGGLGEGGFRKWNENLAALREFELIADEILTYFKHCQSLQSKLSNADTRVLVLMCVTSSYC